MSKFSIYLFTLFFIIISSCAPFVIKKNKVFLKEFENKEYRLKNDVKIAEHHLKKGEKIYIKIKDGKDSIKVYAFPANKDPLKVKWVLILYVFDDEFEKKKFDMEYFKKKLFEVVY